MNRDHTVEGRAAGSSPAMLRAPWLFLARAGGVVLAILLVGLSLLAIPLGFHQLQVVCTAGHACADAQLSAIDARALHELGVAPGIYAIYAIALRVGLAAVFGAVAALIAWRRSHERMAFFSAFTLATFGGATFPDTLTVLTAVSPLWQWPVLALEFLGSAAIIPYFYVFPDGRFVPRWSRWLAVAWLLLQAPLYLPGSPGKDPASVWFWPFQAAIFVGILSAALTQLYRYRHVSSPLQRQQTKVVVFGVTAAFGGFLGVTVGVAALAQALANAAVVGLVVGLVRMTAEDGLILLIPLSIGAAILRYRLWDIDLLINRALVYAALTAALGAFYAGSVLLVSQLLSGVIGQHSTVAVVIATLAVVAIVQPLRRRIQRDIDRAFYRRKYDAARALAAFSVRLRDEVELTTVTADLLAVVEDTLQPAHASLWLRPPEQDR